MQNLLESFQQGFALTMTYLEALLKKLAEQ